MDLLLAGKRMAAAVDIDDTLVKAIPEQDMEKYPAQRVHILNNLPIVVAVSTDAERFLQQASAKFKLSLYSVGTPEYVKEIASILDPHRTLFDWNAIESGASSARHEHDHAGEAAPKKLERLFAFCNGDDGAVDYQLTLAVDDNPKAWSSSCRNRVVQVYSGFDDEGTWDSDLTDAWARMERIHGKTMLRFAAAAASDPASPPAAVPDEANALLPSDDDDVVDDVGDEF